jgi:hypothetical protein
MKRFLGSWLFLLILGGVLIYFQKNQGWLGWLGHIPGDVILRREGRILYLPLASALVITILLSSLSYLFKSEKKN